MSSSEDENLKKFFAESVDKSVFNDGLYNKEKREEKIEKIELKSQRVLDSEETIFHSEINTSKTMQEFIGKKLSKLIQDQVEFVDVKEAKRSSIEEDPTDNLRLLKGSDETVKHLDEPSFIDTRKKVLIKRRQVEDSDLGESQKIKYAAINPEDIGQEVKSWNKKPRHQTTDYKNLKGIGYIREPTNEFTKARNKNGWGESKIKIGKFHNPPMTDLNK